jgi:hypothetical protein
MKTKQQIRNLEKLLVLWELTPPEAVNMGSWYGEGSMHPCGAVACLGGHAAASGVFNGLTLERAGYDGSSKIPVYRNPSGFGRFVGGGAAETLFGDGDLFNARSSRHNEALWQGGVNGGYFYDDWTVAHHRILRALGRLS